MNLKDFLASLEEGASLQPQQPETREAVAYGSGFYF